MTYSEYSAALQSLTRVPAMLAGALTDADASRAAQLSAAATAATQELERLSRLRRSAEARYASVAGQLAGSGVTLAPQVRAAASALEVGRALAAVHEAETLVARDLAAVVRAQRLVQRTAAERASSAQAAADAHTKWQANARRQRAEADAAAAAAIVAAASAATRRRWLIIAGAFVAVIALVVILVLTLG
ncbi:hypothetical protein E3O06_11505 [Cryobacterium glaciale]|uniref:Uncharacterized protein n=1 Tax=Cryobacterium glaciale TaxID=1259145 RepID=A0A4R8UWK7_9MICO|nr:hypothetical protein [Cryobacterium glaciale]TFB71880.1 hypothetical protein E3O06_11505 [Cryobacterium glaciale]